MPGTLIWFSGLTANKVTLRRSVGLEPDAGFVEIPLASFPGHDTFVAPAPGAAHIPPALPDPPPIGVLSGTRPAQVGDLVAQPIGHQAVLYVAESVPTADGGARQEFEMTVRQLYVTDVQRFITGRQGGSVRVSFVDFRAFADRGHMDRWRFGILDNEGNIEPDSLLNGEAPTLAAVARYVVSRMFGEPELIVVPDEWEKLTGSFLFDRWGSAIEAMRVLLERHPAEFVLHWNGTVGLYEEGAGNFGYTVGTETDFASVNGVALPPWVQDMRGQGHVDATSYGYPSDFVIVGGAPTIASVAIDCWEPVLLLDGTPVSLREGLAELLGANNTVRGIERDIKQIEGEISKIQERNGDPSQAVARKERLQLELARETAKNEAPPQASDEDMAWLQRWVFRYEEFQGGERLTPEAVKILKRDAYRLWRLPGADSYNRHLLPIERRAETVDGVRQSILVESYRYTFRSGKLGISGGKATTSQSSGTAQNQLRTTREALSKIRKEVDAATSDLDANILSAGNAERLGLQAQKGLARLLKERMSAQEKAVAQEALRRGMSLLETARRAEGAGLDDLAQAYTSALTTRHDAEKALDPSSDTSAQLAIYQKLLDLGKAVDAREAQNVGPILEDVKKLQDEQQARFRDKIEGRTAERGDPDEGLFKEIFGTNDARSKDPAARLEDANLGLVRTSLTGWLEREDVPNAAATQLVPKAVRVTFGTQMRPPRDLELPPKSFEWCDTAPENAFPPQMSSLQDRVRGRRTSERGESIAQLELLGVYFAVFARQPGSGLMRIELEAVPKGQAHTRGHDGLQELIELAGGTNKPELDRQAAEIANAVVAERKDLSQTTRRHYLRPWRVNCNGVVKAVEITDRPGQRGFTTLVVTGSGVEPFGDANKTRERKPADKRRPVLRVEETRGERPRIP